jgi:hypothetical protein
VALVWLVVVGVHEFLSDETDDTDEADDDEDELELDRLD